MTNAITEENNIIANIAQMKGELAESRQARHREEINLSDADREVLEAAKAVVAEAQGKLNRLTQEKRAAEVALAELNHRLDSGDESVTTEAIAAEERSIDRASRLIAPAKAEVQKADRALQPLLADSHLALLAAEAIETVSDTPVIITKGSSPEGVDKAIILNQSRPTKGYGTLDCSGEINVSSIGGATFNGASVAKVLTAKGSEVSVSDSRIIFDVARWETPRLRRPDKAALSLIGNAFERAFAHEVSGQADIQHLIAAGYNPTGVKSSHEGISHVLETNLDVNSSEGVAVGTLRALVSSRDAKRWHPMALEGVEANVQGAIGRLRGSLVGSVTDAGRITDVSLTLKGVRQDGWETTPMMQKIGGAPVLPVVGEAELTITFEFEPTDVEA